MVWGADLAKTPNYFINKSLNWLTRELPKCQMQKQGHGWDCRCEGEEDDRIVAAWIWISLK